MSKSKLEQTIQELIKQTPELTEEQELQIEEASIILEALIKRAFETGVRLGTVIAAKSNPNA